MERRTSRGGRDSIDHAPGGHDDLINAVAGALTLVINDRRPALIRTKELMGEDERGIEPKDVDGVLATLYVATNGMAAWTMVGMVTQKGDGQYLLVPRVVDSAASF